MRGGCVFALGGCCACAARTCCAHACPHVKKGSKQGPPKTSVLYYSCKKLRVRTLTQQQVQLMNKNRGDRVRRKKIFSPKAASLLASFCATDTRAAPPIPDEPSSHAGGPHPMSAVRRRRRRARHRRHHRRRITGSAAKGSVARGVVSGALPSVAPRATVRSSPPAPRFRLPAHLGGAPARSPRPLLGKKAQHANFELF